MEKHEENSPPLQANTQQRQWMQQAQRTRQFSILVVDDEANMRHMLATLLNAQGYEVEQAANGSEALAMLVQRDFDYILSDVRMPGMGGLELLSRLGETGSQAIVIMMSAHGAVSSTELVIEAMKRGAYDYISKPFKLDEVLLVLRKAQERERLRRENQRLKDDLRALDREGAFAGMVETSAAMRAVFSSAARLAKLDSTVLICGESGTGKELIARGIHRLSKGESVPFVMIDCAGMAADFLESELFGHVQGAFIGADRDKKGCIESADSGTLFLEGIEELPLTLQKRVLQVLQEQEVLRLGAGQARRVQVRFLAATGQDLQELVEQGLFRQDLFALLHTHAIHIPPLREHPEDILPLCAYFLNRLGKAMGKGDMRLSPGAQTRLLTYDWPGNVRELKSVLERALIVADAHTILPEHLPEHLGAYNKGRRLEDFFGTYSLKTAKKIVEKRLIGRAMEHCGGNKSRAAGLLEISYPALLAKLKEYGLVEKK